MRLLWRRALLVLIHAKVHGHAIMYSPKPRSNVYFGPPGTDATSDGIKIPDFSMARFYANQGCGGSVNLDPGVETPEQAYKPGDTIEVQWKLTIPHPMDALTSGIRIALHFSPDDSFEQNILAGGVVGDPPYDVLPAGPTTEIPVDTIPLQAHKVQLPMKTCDYCVLQWVWGAQSDGGTYIGCADISIKDDGGLPDFSSLQSQEGNELPDGTGVGVASGGGGAGVAIGVTVTVLLLALYNPDNLTLNLVRTRTRTLSRPNPNNPNPKPKPASAARGCRVLLL